MGIFREYQATADGDSERQNHSTFSFSLGILRRHIYLFRHSPSISVGFSTPLCIPGASPNSLFPQLNLHKPAPAATPIGLLQTAVSNARRPPLLRFTRSWKRASDTALTFLDRDGPCTITPDLKVLGPRPSAIAGEGGDLSAVLVGHGRNRLSEIDFIGVRTQRYAKLQLGPPSQEYCHPTQTVWKSPERHVAAIAVADFRTPVLNGTDSSFRWALTWAPNGRHVIAQGHSGRIRGVAPITKAKLLQLG